jgi:hypothetical protein
MKVYVVTHWEAYEYENIEKIFISKDKAEAYQAQKREEYKCPRQYVSQDGRKQYFIEDFDMTEYEVEE